MPICPEIFMQTPWASYWAITITKSNKRNQISAHFAHPWRCIISACFACVHTHTRVPSLQTPNRIITVAAALPLVHSWVMSSVSLPSVPEESPWQRRRFVVTLGAPLGPPVGKNAIHENTAADNTALSLPLWQINTLLQNTPTCNNMWGHTRMDKPPLWLHGPVQGNTLPSNKCNSFSSSWRR